MSTEITAFAENASPVAILTDDKAYSEFYQKVKAAVGNFVPDVSTAIGRAEIKSMAFKVVRSKTALDDAGKKLNEEAREKINAVDAVRRKIREELTALAEEVRRPLTEWETAEDARKAKIEGTIILIKEYANTSPMLSAAEIAATTIKLGDIVLDADVFQDDLGDAISAKTAALARLSDLLAAANQREAEAAELARLRQEKAEREAAEQAERERREREERERLAKEAEEKAAAARAEREAREREEYKRRVAEEAAEAARAVERKRAAEELAAKEAELFAERLKREEAEKAERDRLADIERTKREEEARQADREHRSKIMRAAKEAIMTCGCSEDTARKIVMAIMAGEVPNTRIAF